MKKTLIFISLLASLYVFSQEITPSIENENISTENIYEKVDKMPEYPGGINAFRNKFSQTFNWNKVNGSGAVKSEVQFVISKEGSITDIVAFGENKSMNKEMERSIKAMSKAKWKPAEIKGYPVRYKFKLPITMNF